MNKISGIIICFNEEKNIERCVLNLQKVCDEVIVLDSFSSDRTVEICKSLNVEFHQKKFVGYGEQKIAATKLANMDFILSLDADEILSEKLINEIISLKKNQLADVNYIPRLTNYCGVWVHHCGWYPDKKIRLWKKSCAEWTNQEIHETVQIRSNQASVKSLHNNILHYSFESAKDHYEKINKYSDIQSKNLYERGIRVNKIRKYLSAALKFISIYLIKHGLLDGRTGYLISKRSAYSQFIKYQKLEELVLAKTK